MTAAEAVTALLDQRREQGFDTPPESVAEQLARLIAGRSEGDE